MKEPETLWEVEQINKKKREEKEEIINAVGRNYFLPNKLVGNKINIEGIENPEELLKEFNYIKIHNNGYIKKINKEYRFHCFISQDRKSIYIHSDQIINKKHKSSNKFVGDEKSKICNRIHDIRYRLKHPNKIYYPPIKEEQLSPEEIKKALKNLKRKKLIKKLLFWK